MSDVSLPLATRRAAAGAAAYRPAVTTALTRALVEEWARVGYAALSLEAVTRRAGAGKAALYRRWPSKLAMVSDSLATLSRAGRPWPDRGSLEADLAFALRDLRRLLRHPLLRRILLDLHAEMPRSPDLARLVRDHVQAPTLARLAELVERAKIRRELPPGRDAGPVADTILAPLYWRLVVRGGRVDDAWLDGLAATVLAELGWGARLRIARELW